MLPDLSNLRLVHTGGKAGTKRKADALEPSERECVITKDEFNMVTSNCAKFALRFFIGQADCSAIPVPTFLEGISLLFPNQVPRFCAPINEAAEVSEEEAERVREVFLKGMPKKIKTFSNVLELIDDNRLSIVAYLLASCPPQGKERLSTWHCHALVGLIFKEDEEKTDTWFGVTMGAYPSSGNLKDGCLNRNTCALEVVLGDAVEKCARRENPRLLRIMAKASGPELKLALINELSKIIACKPF